MQDIEIKLGIEHLDINELSRLYPAAGLGERPVEMLKPALANSYRVVTGNTSQRRIQRPLTWRDAFRSF